jgi:multiple sugar transport system ATP-binding protein
MIAGLERVTSGEIHLNGKLINSTPPRHRDIAVVFQNYALYPHKTVAGNLSYALKLRKTPKAEIEERVRRVADMLGIGSLLGRMPDQLSGGQRQRVALGRAIVREPQLFLMDEPLSNLDAKLRMQMRGEIVRLQRRLGVTTIYVTHDQIEAMTMGDRIVVMNDAQVQQIGPPAELYNHPANLFVAGFLGSPPMNFVDAELVNEGGALVAKSAIGNIMPPLNATSALDETSLDDRRVVCGIRPEDVILKPHAGPSNGGGGAITGVVDLTEMVGADTYVSLNIKGVPIQARVPSHLGYQDGQTVQVEFDATRLHLFAKATGASLLRSPERVMNHQQ